MKNLSPLGVSKYSGLTKKYEILSFAVNWMELENI
jgi:hypothetical protein